MIKEVQEEVEFRILYIRLDTENRKSWRAAWRMVMKVINDKPKRNQVENLLNKTLQCEIPLALERMVMIGRDLVQM